mmetsp:Transcript_130017/g.404427  ORF Transcript_130017/g.404427 Transcript_130017/m.404427 type:complete len:567 (-) Transcript_130017:139-1839(-)
MRCLVALLALCLCLAAEEECRDLRTCGATYAGDSARRYDDLPLRFDAAEAASHVWEELHSDADIRVVQLESLLTEHEARSLAGVHMRIIRDSPSPMICGSLRVLSRLDPSISLEEHVFGTNCLNVSSSARHAQVLMRHATFSTAFYAGDIRFTAEFEQRVQRLFGLSPAAGGRFQVTSHPPGTGYGGHADCSGKAVDRAATVLVYLADAEGGQTRFGELGLEVEPRLGRALVWNSMKRGQCLSRSVHAAANVSRGRKFTLQRWYYNVAPPGLGQRLPEPLLPPRPEGAPMLMCDDDEDEAAGTAAGGELPRCRWYDEWTGSHMVPPVADTKGVRVALQPGEVHVVDDFLSPAWVSAVRQRLKGLGSTLAVRNGAVMRKVRSKVAMLEDEVLRSVLLAVVDYANLHLQPKSTVAEYTGRVAPHSAEHLQYGALAKVRASSLAKKHNVTHSGAVAHTDSDFTGRCLSAALHLRAPRAGGEFALLRCPLPDCTALRGAKLQALYAGGGLQDLEEQRVVETRPGRLVLFLAENIHSVRDVLEGARESLFVWMTCDTDDEWGRKQLGSVHG